MVAVGFVLIWGGYSAGLWGWCLFRDYNLTFGQLVSPSRPYSGPWPPAKIPSTQIWPGGQAAAQQQQQAARTGPNPEGETGQILDKLPGINDVLKIIGVRKSGI